MWWMRDTWMYVRVSEVFLNWVWERRCDSLSLSLASHSLFSSHSLPVTFFLPSYFPPFPLFNCQLRPTSNHPLSPPPLLPNHFFLSNHITIPLQSLPLTPQSLPTYPSSPIASQASPSTPQSLAASPTRRPNHSEEEIGGIISPTIKPDPPGCVLGAVCDALLMLLCWIELSCDR